MANLVTTIETLGRLRRPNPLFSYLVRNRVGTGEHKCPCGGWLSHWERWAGRPALFCAVLGCDRPALVGAHVEGPGLPSAWMILPFCHEHNAASGPLIIKGEISAVPANVGPTCGR